jgi:hypothetical protein
LMGRECIVGDGYKFEFDAIFDGQPVKLTKVGLRRSNVDGA